MSDTFTQLIAHIVFSTKNREPWLTGDRRAAAHLYLAKVARDRRCTVFAVNGWTDHVHLLVDHPPTVAVADLVRDLKANSSRWLHEKQQCPAFEWQRGYSAFSVSRLNLAAARQYIEQQEAHHGGDNGLPYEVELRWLDGGAGNPA